MLKLLFIAMASLASENQFEYKEWNYGECYYTKVDDLLFCENKDRICFIDHKAIDDNGYRYIKIACKPNNKE